VPKIQMRSMQLRSQADRARCWLAAYKLMFTWKGRSADEVLQVLRTRTKVDVDGTPPADRKPEDKGPWPPGALCLGLDSSDWVTCARAFGLWPVSGGPFTDDWLKGTMRDFGPMLVNGRFDLGMHTIVLIGYTDDWCGTVQLVWILNPFNADHADIAPRTVKVDWLRKGVEANAGKGGVIQYWTEKNSAGGGDGWLVD
jgi:hypothetical protein